MDIDTSSTHKQGQHSECITLHTFSAVIHQSVLTQLCCVGHIQCSSHFPTMFLEHRMTSSLVDLIVLQINILERCMLPPEVIKSRYGGFDDGLLGYYYRGLGRTLCPTPPLSQGWRWRWAAWAEQRPTRGPGHWWLRGCAISRLAVSHPLVGVERRKGE